MENFVKNTGFDIYKLILTQLLYKNMGSFHNYAAQPMVWKQ